MAEPQVMNYSSAADFLREYYLFRKSSSRAFSFENWAREISYPHRSNLRLIVRGERGLPSQLEKILQDVIFKSARERKYFSLLCEIQRSKSLEKKSLLMKKAQALREHREVVVPNGPASYDLLSSLYMTVYLGFDDVEKTTKGLARILGKDETEIESCLEKLLAAGFVRSKTDKKGKKIWSIDSHYTVFKDDHGNPRLADFHRQSFMKAIAAQRLPQNKRRFDSLVLPMSSDNYSDMVQELDAFLDKLFYKYNTNEIRGKDLYHIQIGTFPAQ